MNLRKRLWRFYGPAADAIGLSAVARWPLFRPVLKSAGYLARRYVFTPVGRVSQVYGHRMVLGSWDTIITPLIANDAWEPGTHHMFQKLLRPGMTVVDVGAHIGLYSLLSARLVGSTGRVYAFEPHPGNFTVLQTNIKLNGYQNIVAINKALIDRSGIMPLSVSARDSGKHALFPNVFSSQVTIPTETISLDSFLQNEGWPEVNLIKMDIEGAEPLALHGMRELIRRTDNLKLIVELNPYCLRAAGVDPQAFLSQLHELGFAISVIRDPKGLDLLDAQDLLEELRRTRGDVNLLCSRTI